MFYESELGSTLKILRNMNPEIGPLIPGKGEPVEIHSRMMTVTIKQERGFKRGGHWELKLLTLLTLKLLKY